MAGSKWDGEQEQFPKVVGLSLPRSFDKLETSGKDPSTQRTWMVEIIYPPPPAAARQVHLCLALLQL